MRFDAIVQSCVKGQAIALGALVVKTNKPSRTAFAHGSIWGTGVTFPSNPPAGIPWDEWCRLASIFGSLAGACQVSSHRPLASKRRGTPIVEGKRRLEHVPEKLNDFFDKNMLQSVDLKRFPLDRVESPDRKTL